MSNMKAAIVKRSLMCAKGKCMTIGDLRTLVQGLEELPHDYEVLVTTDTEFDLAEVAEASIELGEPRTSDGPGWVLLEFKERE